MVSLISAVRPADAPHITLRFAYRKTGALAYISHLDTVRTFQKALLRAGLPLAYSEGFSPHPKLTFAAPLPVGQESECEYMDVRLSVDTPPSEAMAALNATLPAGLSITAAGYPAAKFSSIFSACYLLTIVTEGAYSALAEKMKEALNRRPLLVFKRSKAGDRDVDVSGNIESVTAVYREGAVEIMLTLRAEGGAFLNIDYLLTYLKKETGILSQSPLTERATCKRLYFLTESGEKIKESDEVYEV